CGERRGGKEWGADVVAGVIKKKSFVHHHFRRAHLRIGARDGELNALVLSDRPGEQLTLLSIFGWLGDEPLRITNAFSGHQNALGIHSAKNVAKTFSFLADQIFRRDAQIVEEDLRGRMIHHCADRIDGDILFFSSRRRHTKLVSDWSSDVCSSD